MRMIIKLKNTFIYILKVLSKAKTFLSNQSLFYYWLSIGLEIRFEAELKRFRFNGPAALY